MTYSILRINIRVKKSFFSFVQLSFPFFQYWKRCEVGPQSEMRTWSLRSLSSPWSYNCFKDIFSREFSNLSCYTKTGQGLGLKSTSMKANFLHMPRGKIWTFVLHFFEIWASVTLVTLVTTKHYALYHLTTRHFGHYLTMPFVLSMSLSRKLCLFIVAFSRGQKVSNFDRLMKLQ